jgi:tRNA G18 (ribose-2'-O)-methylase SpoU
MSCALHRCRGSNLTDPYITLIGDGIENPWNARTMLRAAAMFGGDCRFRDRAKLVSAWDAIGLPPNVLRFVATDDVRHGYDPRIAFDTLDYAETVYGFRLPAGERPAVIVGNERRGIAHEMREVANRAVQIPLASRTLTSLNVAAASAVALWYLTHGSGPMHLAAHPHKRRPELLLIGGTDHFELGSTIRSAGAFGWQRMLIEDRAGVWFGAHRVTQSEGRAAARRARNPIHLIPASQSVTAAYDDVCIVTTQGTGTPLHRINLAKGQRQLIVLADERDVAVAAEDWQRLGNVVTFAHIVTAEASFAYHFRLPATITLAEIARQVGQSARTVAGRTRRGPVYEHSLTFTDDGRGETVFLEDLKAY